MSNVYNLFIAFEFVLSLLPVWLFQFWLPPAQLSQDNLQAFTELQANWLYRGLYILQWHDLSIIIYMDLHLELDN